MSEEIVYIDYDEALTIYGKMIDASDGGFEGVRDEGGIRATLDFVQNDLYYPTFAEKLTYLMYRFCSGHFFNDGNKRIALTLGAYFLHKNNYYWHACICMRTLESIIAYSYYAGGAILLLTVLVTSFKTREYPPGEFARYNNLSEEDAKPMSFVGLMRNVPGVMVRLGVTQFFSWAALFLMWTYLKPAITGVVTDHATGEVLSAGATQTWVGVLNGTYPIPACIAALFLGRVAARYGNKPVYAACLLAGALGFAGLCLLHDQYALMLPMVGIGIAWAGILAMPYAILSRAVEPRRMGVYMGIFNFTITVPQIVIGLTGGAIVKYCFASDAADMLALAGVFMLLAAVSVFLVKEHKAQ